MAPKRAQQPKVRKSVLVFGGIAVAVVALAFVLVTFVGGGGGGGGDVPAPSTQPGTAQGTGSDTPQAPVAPAGLRPGGRDPFRPVVNLAPPAPAANPS